MYEYEKLERVERRMYEVCNLCNSLESAVIATSDPVKVQSLYKDLEKASRKFTALATQREALRKACMKTVS